MRRVLLLALLLCGFTDAPCPITSVWNQTPFTGTWYVEGHLQFLAPNSTEPLDVFTGEIQELSLVLPGPPGTPISILHVEKSGDRLRAYVDQFPGDTAMKMTTWGRLKARY